MSTCNTRWWVLAYGRACGPVVITTTDEDQGPSRRIDLPGGTGYEVIDRHADPLPPASPFVVA